MKHVLIAAFVAALIGGMANLARADEAAGTGDAKGEKKALRHEKFKAALAKLNLTDEQKTKIKEIFKKAHSDAQAAADKSAKLEIWKAAVEEAKKVLTAEQLEKLKEFQAERRKHAKDDK